MQVSGREPGRVSGNSRDGVCRAEVYLKCGDKGSSLCGRRQTGGMRLEVTASCVGMAPVRWDLGFNRFCWLLH